MIRVGCWWPCVGVTCWLIEGRGHGPVGGSDAAAPLESSNDVTDRHESSQRDGCNGVISEPQTSDMIGARGKSHASEVMRRAGLVCRQCRRVVTGLSVLRRHLRRAHATATLVCQSCSAAFSSRLDLQCHCRQMHHDSVGNDVIKCRQCRRVFTDSLLLQRHLKLHQARVKPLASLSAAV